MKSFAIHGLPIKPTSIEQVKILFNYLKKNNVKVVLSEKFATVNRKILDLTPFPQYPNELNKGDVEVILSLGGDGTLLDTLTHVGETEIPILGINLGRLGFLSNISKDNIEETFNMVLSNKFTIEKRTLLELETSQDYFAGKRYALNEFAMLRSETSAMISVEAKLNDEYLNTYWADGLMVTTSTGSTGYSLSCGGPIMMPNAKNFIITPISPHNLNVRPLVVPENSQLEFTVISRERHYLISLDSRSAKVSDHEIMKIKKAKFFACLIILQNNSFIKTLRNKLNWGFDQRN